MSSSEPSRIRALIVDDEPLARERLRELLDERSDTAVVGEAEDGPEATAAIREQNPDLVFLDVQMPGMSGIDVIEKIGSEQMPVVVFVTAYDQYAIKAFDLAAVDYLLKPFDDERFEQALSRAQERIADQEAGAVSERLMQLLKERNPALLKEETEAEESYLERIAVQGHGKSRIVPVDDITHITADGSYAELHTAGGTHLVRERMKTLTARLDPEEFVRVHRSAIVRLEEIELVLRGGAGDYAVRLKDGTRVSVSRGRIDELQDRLGVDVTQKE